MARREAAGPREVADQDQDFIARFGRRAQIVASAPGRVNLIGEHTDYNLGFVLPTPIPQRTTVRLAPVPGSSQVRAASAQEPTPAGWDGYDLLAPKPGRGWLDYVQGATAALASAGHALSGFDVLVTSQVPPGAGLSSSAALLVALLRGLRQLFHLSLDDLTLALLARRAETDFVGAPVGVMDQMVCSLGRPGQALLIDTQDLRTEHVPLPAAAELLVIDSGLRHRHAGGEYRTRRAECAEACTLLGVPSLRSLGLADLQRVAALRPPLDRRVRHVILENDRVLCAVSALRQGDLATLEVILYEGHASLRDDYEVSLPPLDPLADLARGEQDLSGARLTGGGFGGAVVMVAAAGRGAAVGRRVVAAYLARTGLAGEVLVPPCAQTSESKH